jgi:hypothetical protein
VTIGENLGAEGIGDREGLSRGNMGGENIGDIGRDNGESGEEWDSRVQVGGLYRGRVCSICGGYIERVSGQGIKAQYAGIMGRGQEGA